MGILQPAANRLHCRHCKGWIARDHAIPQLHGPAKRQALHGGGRRRRISGSLHGTRNSGQAARIDHANDDLFPGSGELGDAQAATHQGIELVRVRSLLEQSGPSRVTPAGRSRENRVEVAVAQFCERLKAFQDGAVRDKHGHARELRYRAELAGDAAGGNPVAGTPKNRHEFVPAQSSPPMHLIEVRHHDQ